MPARRDGRDARSGRSGGRGGPWRARRALPTSASPRTALGQAPEPEPGAGPSLGTPPGVEGGRQSRLVFQTRTTEAPERRGTAQHGIGGEWDLGDPGPPRLQMRGRGALGASQGRDLHSGSPHAGRAAGHPSGNCPLGLPAVGSSWSACQHLGKIFARTSTLPLPAPEGPVWHLPTHTAKEGGLALTLQAGGKKGAARSFSLLPSSFLLPRCPVSPHPSAPSAIAMVIMWQGST